MKQYSCLFHSSIPLNTCQYCSHIVCWRPSVLQDIQAKLPRRIHIWMKHLADELDRRRFIGVLFLEMHNESEGSVFEGSVGRSDNNGVPLGKRSASLNQDILLPGLKNSLPSHNIVCDRRCRYTSRWIRLHALDILSVFNFMIVCSDEAAVATNLKVAHQTTPSSSRHDGRVKSGARYKY